MKSVSRTYITHNVKLPINASQKEAFSVTGKRLRALIGRDKGLEYKIFKKSIDARDKNDVLFVYSVMVIDEFTAAEAEVLRTSGLFTEYVAAEPKIEIGDEPMRISPIVVGTGPAGLFAGLLLAEMGYRPILLERGGDVKTRISAVDTFNKYGILQTDTNIQFGAGGAGTFSDGKLITRTNDPLTNYVLRRFVDFGAPDSILYEARPHIGTDVLSLVVERMLAEIERLGGKVLYNTTYFDSFSESTKSYAKTSVGDLPYSALILAIGHSARDTYETLIKKGFCIEPKAFSVGMRIEHLVEEIDFAMYGKFANDPKIGHAEYNLAYDTKNRGVYTFCMCPGGEVVAAASEQGGLVVNGMSKNARDGKNSNSAVVCSVFRDDYGNTPQKAIEFQRSIERAAFLAGGSDFSAPVITVGDFISDKCETKPKKVTPTYRGGEFYKLASPKKYLPGFVSDKIKEAIRYFDRKIAGFAAPYAVLSGAETRTSAPIRILRDANTHLALGRPDIYPCGEGAGYAGGITSAATDGLKTAIALIKRYKPEFD